MTASPQDGDAFAEPGGPGFSDAVTLAFGDRGADVYGLMRIGVSPGQETSASALGLLFAGGDVAESVAEGGLGLEGAGWDSVRAGPLHFSAEEPGAAWRVRWGETLDLRFSATSPPVELGGGGMEGDERVCRVEGRVRTRGAERRLRCLGQRGRSRGVADWDRVELARTVCAWWDDGRALVLSALRPAGAGDHEREELTAWLLEDGAEPSAVAEPRLTTTYDAQGRQRRAGMELFVTGDDDEFPRRAAGQVACGTSLELGRLRLHCAFFEWGMEGRTGVGRYDVLRRT